MPFDLELPDGSVLTDIPDGTTKQDIINKLGYDPAAEGPNGTPIPGVRARGVQRTEPSMLDRVIGAGEAALSIVTGIPSGLVTPLPAFAAGVGASIQSGEFGTDQGARRIRDTVMGAAERFTYAPRTDQGQRQTAALGNALAQTVPLMPMAAEIGAVTGNAARSPTAVIAAGVARDVSRRARDASKPVVQRARTATTQGAQRAATAVADTATRAGTAVADATARTVTRVVNPDRLKRAQEAARREPSVTDPEVLVDPAVAAAERATAYARDRLGARFSDLPAAIQADLKAVARDATALEGLDPVALRRQALLEGLPVRVPSTRGDLTRDLSQLTREQNIVKTEAGAPIRNIRAEQDVALPANIDTLRGRGKVQTRQGLGTTVQGALRDKKREVSANRRRLYEIAEESGATQVPVEVALLDEWLMNPQNKRNAGYIASALDQYREGPNAGITINRLEAIRQEANAHRKGPPSATSHYAGKAIEVIDDILDRAMEAMPEGNPYRAARAAYRAEKAEFDRQARIKALVTERGMTADRAVALEDTLDHVMRSSAADIRAIRKSLTSGGTPQTRQNGAQAWRDLRVGVLERLKEAGIGRRDIPGEQGQSQFNSSFLNAYNELRADGKIAALFSPKEVALLDRVAEAVRLTRTTPSGRIAGSDTASNAMAIAERVINALPVGGNITRGVIAKGMEMIETGKEAARVREATTAPLREAAQRPPPKPRQPTMRDILDQPPSAPTP